MIDNHQKYRQLFPFSGQVVYMNHAAVSPLNSRAIAAMQAYQKERSSSNIEYWPDLFDKKRQFKELVGKLINAHPDYIAMAGNTGMGLNILALGIDWKAGDRILLNNLEFPTNVYPFMNLKRFGVEVDFVAHREGRILLEDIVEKIHPRTRLLSISFVEFLNGFRNDMRAIADICRKHDIIFSVDGIQGIGALQFDVQEMGIDFLACGGHKWLMWPLGTAFFYIAPRIFESVYPAMVNWMSVENAWDMLNYELKLLPNAERFEGGVFNLQGLIGAIASLELFSEIGVAISNSTSSPLPIF
ncbi:MAG: aminotransferase class V-fold PLP-dependent enzyme [Calditrichia bacterium]